jgi:hypothetical protein
MAFSIGDIVTPALMTALLAHGSAATWIPLVALAAVDILGILALAHRLPAMRYQIGRSTPDTSRLIEPTAFEFSERVSVHSARITVR